MDGCVTVNTVDCGVIGRSVEIEKQNLIQNINGDSFQKGEFFY